MLSIHLHGKADDATPWFYEGTIAELFRTWSVIGESVVFVEVSPGHLINLAHIERIVEEQDDEPARARVVHQPTDGEGTHEGPRIGCEECNRIVEDQAARLRAGQTMPIEPRETGHEYRPRITDSTGRDPWAGANPPDYEG